MKFQNILQVPDLALVYMKYCAQRDIIKLFVLSRGIRAVILSAMKLLSFPLKLISPKTNITDTELKDVLSSSIFFKFVSSLSLPKCRELTDESLKLFQFLINLKKLSLHGCCQVSNSGLVHLIHCSKLVSLDLSYCSKITRLKAISGLYVRLMTLNLTQCSNLRQVTFTSVCSITTNITPSSLLRNLNLSLCRHINDKRLSSCLQLLPCLQVLSLNGCSNVSDAGLLSIRDYCPEITELDISWLYQVTRTGLVNSLGQLPSLVAVSMHGMKSHLIDTLRILIPSAIIITDN
jgi:hypothetical protein